MSDADRADIEGRVEGYAVDNGNLTAADIAGVTLTDDTGGGDRRRSTGIQAHVLVSAVTSTAKLSRAAAKVRTALSGCCPLDVSARRVHDQDVGHCNCINLETDSWAWKSHQSFEDMQKTISYCIS